VKVIRWFINFSLAVIALITGLYFTISVAVLFFIVSGKLTVGQLMYIDLITPKISSLLVFQAICITIISTCFFIRAKIGKKDDFKIFQSKRR